MLPLLVLILYSTQVRRSGGEPKRGTTGCWRLSAFLGSSILVKIRPHGQNTDDDFLDRKFISLGSIVVVFEEWTPFVALFLDEFNWCSSFIHC